jgi:hypothetical protein
VPTVSAREQIMNMSLATIESVFRNARHKAETQAHDSEFGKWIIIAAAIFGALMLMRGLRKFTRLLFAFFWIWFWTHGAYRYIF